MALDKDVRGNDHRDDAPVNSKSSVGYQWKSPDELDAMADEEYAAWEATWVEECNRRIADYDAGRETTVSLEEVTARLDALLA